MKQQKVWIICISIHYKKSISKMKENPLKIPDRFSVYTSCSIKNTFPNILKYCSLTSVYENFLDMMEKLRK